MSDDATWLRKYVEERSETAFAATVDGHLNLVYSAALRETNGDEALAQDISQEVFAELARQAHRLLKHPSLAGWLYTTVRHRAGNLRRSDSRRQRREQEAGTMAQDSTEPSPNDTWEEIKPVLDDALHELKEGDRMALVLRFLEDLPLREVGDTLGLGENAARMRVDRALEKLRVLLARRGVRSNASAIGAAMAVGAIVPAPPAFATSVAGAVLVNAAVVSTSVPFSLMAISKVKLGLACVLLTGAVAVPVWQQQRVNAARAAVERLDAEQKELVSLREQAVQSAQAEAEKVQMVQAELEQLREYKAQTMSELLRLRAMAGVARRANAEAAELRAKLQAVSTTGPGQLAGPMGDFMRVGMEQEASNRLARISSALNLTHDQAQSIGEIFKRQARLSSAGVEQVMSGKFSQEELTRLAKETGDPERQIKALLTPEQQEAYKTYKQDENARTARLSAHMELLQMQGSLGLTPEQQDQVFGAIYDVTLNQLNGAVKPSSGSSENPMQWIAEQKTKAVEPLLSPTQLASYRQQQDAQLKFMKEIQGKMNPSARSTPH